MSTINFETLKLGNKCTAFRLNFHPHSVTCKRVYLRHTNTSSYTACTLHPVWLWSQRRICQATAALQPHLHACLCSCTSIPLWKKKKKQTCIYLKTQSTVIRLQRGTNTFFKCRAERKQLSTCYLVLKRSLWSAASSRCLDPKSGNKWKLYSNQKNTKTDQFNFWLNVFSRS